MKWLECGKWVENLYEKVYDFDVFPVLHVTGEVA